MFTKSLALFVLPLFFIVLGSPASGEENPRCCTEMSPTPDDPAYLTVLSAGNDFGAFVKAFAEDFPPQPPGSSRHMAFGIKLNTLNTPVEKLRKQLTDALDTAEHYNYPVLVTLDDWNFPKPSSDPEIVEWTDWPAPGESHGPLVKGRWVNWGFWLHTEPPVNFESVKFRAQVTQTLQQAVISPLVDRLATWKEKGTSHLFAGLVVGWETGYYTFYNRDHVDLANPPEAGKHRFTEDDFVGTGFAALTARGHTAESVRKLAQERGCSEHMAIKQLMDDVTRDYIGFWARTCAQGGVPRERTYSHIATMRTLPEADRRFLGVLEDGRLCSVDVAVQPWCRPGATVTREWCDISAVIDAFHKRGERAWGAVELEITDAIREEKAALDYLSRLTDAGARVIAIYGWWEAEGNPFQVRGTGAVKAMQRWLQSPDVSGATQ